jgi:hypothetical protein
MWGLQYWLFLGGKLEKDATDGHHDGHGHGHGHGHVTTATAHQQQQSSKQAKGGKHDRKPEAPPPPPVEPVGTIHPSPFLLSFAGDVCIARAPRIDRTSLHGEHTHTHTHDGGRE